MHPEHMQEHRATEHLTWKLQWLKHVCVVCCLGCGVSVRVLDKQTKEEKGWGGGRQIWDKVSLIPLSYQHGCELACRSLVCVCVCTQRARWSQSALHGRWGWVEILSFIARSVWFYIPGEVNLLRWTLFIRVWGSVWLKFRDFLCHKSH